MNQLNTWVKENTTVNRVTKEELRNIGYITSTWCKEHIWTILLVLFSLLMFLWAKDYAMQGRIERGLDPNYGSELLFLILPFVKLVIR